MKDIGIQQNNLMGDDIDGYVEDQKPRRIPNTPVQNVPLQRVHDVKMKKEDSSQLYKEQEIFTSKGMNIE